MAEKSKISPQDTPRNRAGELLHLFRGKAGAFQEFHFPAAFPARSACWKFANDTGKRPFSFRLQGRSLLSCNRCQAAEALLDAGIVRRKLWKELEPHAVPEAAGHVIRRVVTGRDASFRAIANERFLSKRQERPREVALFIKGGDARKTVKARAAQKVQEHGFRLVIRMMRRADDIRTCRLARFFEKRIAQAPGCRFHGFARSVCNRTFFCCSRITQNAMLPAELFHKRGIFLRCRTANPMFIMRCRKGEMTHRRNF